jgi:putative RNase toxin 10 of polymorphic toxin system
MTQGFARSLQVERPLLLWIPWWGRRSESCGRVSRPGAQDPTTGGGQGSSQPVPSELARVVAGSKPLTTLGREGADDVFVVAADDIAGMNAAQLAQRLTVPASDTFTVIRFPTPASGVASPLFRTNPGFLQGGLTRGGAREFVIPNGPIPPGATTTVIGP